MFSYSSYQYTLCHICFAHLQGRTGHACNAWWAGWVEVIKLLTNRIGKMVIFV